MSYLLPHLHTGFAVDQAILSVSAQPLGIWLHLTGANNLYICTVMHQKLAQEQDLLK